MASSPIDHERLKAALGGENLAWLLSRLRQRMERGRPLRGTINVANISPAERDALNRLLGRLPSNGASMSIDLGQLETTLRHARLCDNLCEAVESVLGPVVNRRELKAVGIARWKKLFEIRRQPLDSRWHPWLAGLQESGLLRRLSENDIDVARLFLDHAISILEALPCHGKPLAELAAIVLGDSHALDVGKPVGTLVVRAIADPLPQRVSQCTQAERTRAKAALRRDAWASVGVMIDELSSPVLVLNLKAQPNSLTGCALNLYAEAGEPCRLSVRQLLRQPPSFVSSEEATIFICENPTVVAAAASRLGSRSHPLICTDGQPKTALTLLLSLLKTSGFTLAYHGDFDWPGIQIANLIIERHGATPWRFDTESFCRYRGKRALSGSPVAAIWDADLMPAMTEAGFVIYEEQLLDELLCDLGDQ